MDKTKSIIIFPYLNLLRFVAALVIVFHHFSIQVPPFDQGFLNQWIGNGNFMVNLFFILSGFVLMHNYGQKDFTVIGAKKSFYIKRAKRLLPLFYLGMLVSTVYVVCIIGKVDLIRLVVSFAGLQSFDLWNLPIVNVPSWSLSVEFFLYLIFPFVLISFSKLKRGNFLFLTMFFWFSTEVILYILDAHYQLHFATTPFFSVGTFFLGMAIYNYRNDIYNWKLSYKRWAVIIAVLLVTFVLYQPFLYKHFHGQLAPLFGLMILLLASLKQVIKKEDAYISNQLGDLSYAIYILHWPIYEVYGLAIEFMGFPSRHVLPIFIGYLIAVLLFSWIATQLQMKFFAPKQRQVLPLQN